MEETWQCPSELQMRLSFDLAILLLRICPTSIPANTGNDVYTGYSLQHDL